MPRRTQCPPPWWVGIRTCITKLLLCPVVVSVPRRSLVRYSGHWYSPGRSWGRGWVEEGPRAWGMPGVVVELQPANVPHEAGGVRGHGGRKLLQKGGLRDPLIPVEVRGMLRLAPELLQACFYVLVLQCGTHGSACRLLHPHWPAPLPPFDQEAPAEQNSELLSRLLLTIIPTIMQLHCMPLTQPSPFEISN